MAGLSRRRFLQTAAMAGSALAMGGGRTWAQESAPGAAAPDHAAMAIARWQGAAEAFPQDFIALGEKLAHQAMVAVGGMKRFVKKGDVVWIKPNIGWDATPEQAADTNPGVVAALVKMCLESGAKTVKVGDNCCNPPQKAYANSGIEAAVKAAGGEMVYLDENRYREMTVGGARLDKWQIYPEIVESDLVINVPVVKHHGLSKATMCMKNYMGVIGGQRSAWHQDLPACLSDITAFMKPKICVLDAVQILTNHGPRGGDLADVKKVGIVAAGTDIVALDAFGATLLGHTPADIATVVAAEKAGLGTVDYTKLAPKEVVVS